MESDTSLYCIKCGYDLRGLSQRGSCPECGEYFDRETGQGIRSAASRRQDKVDRMLVRLRTLCLLLGAIMVMVCSGLLGLAFGVWAKPLAIGGVFAAVFILAAITSYVYEKED